jgi:hypothetical protein
VAGISSVDPSFPLYLWKRLLPQEEITYIKTAFALPGCKLIAHEKPGKSRTWATHGQHGYSLVPAMHHYRCQNVYISATASKRIVDTLEFFLTIIRCHSYLPLTDCSWQPTTCPMHYKTLIHKYHSLKSGMTPSQRSRHWQKFSNSNLKNLTFPTFQLLLPKTLSKHAWPKHPVQS